MDFRAAGLGRTDGEARRKGQESGLKMKAKRIGPSHLHLPRLLPVPRLCAVYTDGIRCLQPHTRKTESLTAASSGPMTSSPPRTPLSSFAPGRALSSSPSPCSVISGHVRNYFSTPSSLKGLRLPCLSIPSAFQGPQSTVSAE